MVIRRDLIRSLLAVGAVSAAPPLLAGCGAPGGVGDLGMPTAFDELRADFSRMTTEEELHISAVVHEAFIAVDEQGTEAAADTAVVMRVRSLPYADVTLDADRAFLFVIHDVETATPCSSAASTTPPPRRPSTTEEHHWGDGSVDQRPHNRVGQQPSPQGQDDAVCGQRHQPVGDQVRHRAQALG